MSVDSLSLVFRSGNATREISLDAVSDFVGDGQNFLWIELHAPGGALLAKLGEELSLHELSLEDALTTHQRPKLEEYSSHLFLSLKTMVHAENGIVIRDLHLFIGPNFMVIIHHGPSLDLSRARARLAQQHNGFKPDRTSALYFILDEVVDHYGPAITALHDHFDALEGLMLRGGLQHHDLEKLYTVKREGNVLREAIDPMQGIVLDLIRVHPDVVSKELRVYFRDVHDHVLRAVRTLDQLRAAASDAMQFHMATLTLRQNEAVQKLAGWGAILAIPTVIFSLYGMNFKSMPELTWWWAYPVVVVGTLLGAYLLYRRLRKRGWI